MRFVLPDTMHHHHNDDDDDNYNNNNNNNIMELLKTTELVFCHSR
jgi:hypothetical protein